ncbi:MAG: site-specific integrase [bacterium]
MTAKKLTKLAKRLKKFTFEEFLIMSGEDEQTVKIFLDEFFAVNKIKFDRDNKYKYNEFIPVIQIKEFQTKEKQQPDFFSQTEIDNLDIERKTVAAFKNAPLAVQNMINKYVDLLKEVKNANGKILLSYIVNVWNIQHPDMKTSKASFVKARKILKTTGITGLISPMRKYISVNDPIDEDVYNEIKEYFLQNTDKSLKENFLTFKADYLKNNIDSQKWEFPTYYSVTARIKKDILKFNDFSLAKMFDEKKKFIIIQKKLGFKTFRTAAEDYIKDLAEKNEVEEVTCKNYKAMINFYSIPFFQNIKLKDIDVHKLKEYKTMLEEQQLSPRSIKVHINLVRKILKIYLDTTCRTSASIKIGVKFLSEANILEKEIIIRLLRTCKKEFPDFYPLLVTAVNTGITRGEVLALTWDKYEPENKRLLVNKSIYKGQILTLRTREASRYIDLPDTLVEILSELRKNPTSTYIFPNEHGRIQDPEIMINTKFLPLINKAGLENIKFLDLRDSYAAFLIQQNIPLSYVKKQFGFTNMNVLVDRYKDFIPQKTKENLCLI